MRVRLGLDLSLVRLVGFVSFRYKANAASDTLDKIGDDLSHVLTVQNIEVVMVKR